jgi:hypothetical protein
MVTVLMVAQKLLRTMVTDWGQELVGKEEDLIVVSHPLMCPHGPAFAELPSFFPCLLACV